MLPGAAAAEGRGWRTRPQERPRFLHLLQALVNIPMMASLLQAGAITTFSAQ